MFKVVIIGQKSKIGSTILSIIKSKKTLTLIKESRLDHEKIDYLILCSNEKRCKDFINKYRNNSNINKIIDYSGALKNSIMNGDNNITYAFNSIYDSSKKMVAHPGCSSLGILTALYPIKDEYEIDNCFIDVKFSKSTLKYNSQNLNNLTNNTFGLLYDEHYHQKEVNYFLNKTNISIAPSIIDIDNGISLNIFIQSNKPHDLIDKISVYYTNDNNVNITKDLMDIKSVVGTSKINIYFKKTGNGLIINVLLDNLFNDRFLRFI